MLARVIAVDAVLDGGVRLDRAEAVGKSFWYEEPFSAISGQHGSGVFAIARRTPADIDGDVENRTRRHLHQLGLGEWRDLEMQPSDDIGAVRVGAIFLHEVNLDPVAGEDVLSKRLGKEATRVAVTHRPDQQDVGKRGFKDQHC
jgi:hypothetical protein